MHTDILWRMFTYLNAPPAVVSRPRPPPVVQVSSLLFGTALDDRSTGAGSNFLTSSALLVIKWQGFQLFHNSSG